MVSLSLASRVALSVQDTITMEDEKFRAFLEANGYDTSTMGNREQGR